MYRRRQFKRTMFSKGIKEVARMFVVKKPVTVNKTIRLPEELLKRMETIASQKDISLNQLIVQCCEYALNDLAEEPQTESRTES